MKKSLTKGEPVISKDYSKMVKGLQITAGVFMLLMLIACVVLLKRFDISIKNLGAVQVMLADVRGGVWTLAIGMILFSIIKSFALIFPPAILFALSGLMFENIWVALLVNLLATALSLSLPYYLGRFTGKPMLNTLKTKFPKIGKLDSFAGENEFTFIFILKVSGIVASDLSSLIFGTMNIPYCKYTIASNLGLLPLNILWTLLGAKGDLTNPYTLLYILPIIVFSVVSLYAIKLYSKKKESERQIPSANQ